MRSRTRAFIKRDPHPNHRRTLPATLTAKGRRVLAACEEAVSEFEDAMFDGFPDRDREAFFVMIKAAVRNLGGGFPE
jgi:DNA-binding MarR family transcriptional regulator